MDTKSLAKSKRAHSQHHSKKHHPNRNLKGPSSSSIGASSSKTPPGKEIKEKPRPPQGSSTLISNWDRYEDDFDMGTEDQSRDCINQPTDVLLPKSKGADYAYLISEAKSQNQTICSTEIFPSFNDVVQDFDQGMGTFLSVRGESILSWVEGDSFIVEDKATTSNEVQEFHYFYLLPSQENWKWLSSKVIDIGCASQLGFLIDLRIFRTLIWYSLGPEKPKMKKGLSFRDGGSTKLLIALKKFFTPGERTTL